MDKPANEKDSYLDPGFLERLNKELEPIWRQVVESLENDYKKHLSEAEQQ